MESQRGGYLLFVTQYQLFLSVDTFLCFGETTSLPASIFMILKKRSPPPGSAKGLLTPPWFGAWPVLYSWNHLKRVCTHLPSSLHVPHPPCSRLPQLLRVPFLTLHIQSSFFPQVQFGIFLYLLIPPCSSHELHFGSGDRTWDEVRLPVSQ